MASIISTKTSGGGGIAVTGDTSGIMQLASNDGTTAVTIDASQNVTTVGNTYLSAASGNVGIGTTSPASKLNVETNSSSTTIGGSSSVIAVSNSNGSTFNLTAGLELYGSGTVSGGNKNAGVYGLYESYTGSGNRGALVLATNGGASNVTERARISSAGDLAVGQTATSGSATGNTADVYAGGLIINPSRRTSSGSANTVWETSAGVFYRSTSSIKYKQNVTDAVYGLNEVMQLRPVTYEGKSEVDVGKRFGGFIAEEVDAIGLNEFVVYDENNEPDSLGYDRMVSLLTKAIQEQQAIITDLKARIEVLEAK